MLAWPIRSVEQVLGDDLPAAAFHLGQEGCRRALVLVGTVAERGAGEERLMILDGLERRQKLGPGQIPAGGFQRLDDDVGSDIAVLCKISELMRFTGMPM